MKEKGLKIYNDCLFGGVTSFLIVVLMQIALNAGNGGISNMVMIIILFSVISAICFTICLGIRLTLFNEKVLKLDTLAVIITALTILVYLPRFISIL